MWLESMSDGAEDDKFDKPNDGELARYHFITPLYMLLHNKTKKKIQVAGSDEQAIAPRM